MSSASPAPTSAATPALVLYDGECGLCARSVQFILRRDPRGNFRFAALQSARGQRLLAEHGLPSRQFNSLVLIRDGRAYLRSDAGLGICRGLRGAWPLLAVFRFVPPAWRDAAYDWIARRRLSLAPPACALPTPAERARFLE